MILEPNCYKRECKHYGGVKDDGPLERDERNFCRAFPDGIPEDIAYGDDLHLVLLGTETTNVTFEQGPRDFEEDV
jgi:hypothetical protein